MYGCDSVGNNQEHTQVKIGKNDLCINLPFPYYCRNLFLTSPIDTLSETSSVQEGDTERVDVLRFLLVMVNLKHGSDNPSANKKYPTISSSYFLFLLARKIYEGGCMVS
jgi:hypothetical protein